MRSVASKGKGKDALQINPNHRTTTCINPSWISSGSVIWFWHRKQTMHNKTSVFNLYHQNLTWKIPNRSIYVMGYDARLALTKYETKTLHFFFFDHKTKTLHYYVYNYIN